MGGDATLLLAMLAWTFGLFLLFSEPNEKETGPGN